MDDEFHAYHFANWIAYKIVAPLVAGGISIAVTLAVSALVIMAIAALCIAIGKGWRSLPGGARGALVLAGKLVWFPFAMAVGAGIFGFIAHKLVGSENLTIIAAGAGALVMLVQGIRQWRDNGYPWEAYH